MLGPAFVELAALLVGVDVADDPVMVGVLRDRLEPTGRDRADAVRRHPDLDAGHRCGPDSERFHPGQERLDVGVAEAALSRRRREVAAVPAAAVIRRRKQHDRQTGVDGGLRDRVRHRVRLGIRGAVGLVVDVVELADDGVSGADHLAVGLDRHREEEAERFRKVVLRLQQVISCHAISGESDFLLEIVVADLNEYSEFVLKRLRKIPGVKDLHSSFALEAMKTGTALPLPGDNAEPCRP